ESVAVEKRLRSEEPREVIRQILQHRKEGAAGGAYSSFLKKDGIPGEEKIAANVFPDVMWVSTKTKTREPGDLEDRAARFLIDQNLLLINADFRVFLDMINRWQKEFGGGETVKKTVEQ